MDFTPSARVIEDSHSRYGARLTTIEVRLHRYVLAELNTHRAFSRNSASSRAVPVRKMLAKAAEEPAVPLEWLAERPGMQGGDDIADPIHARNIWLWARDAAIDHARQLADLGVHKSITNRLLEPFLPHTVIISSTDWDGFWQQRCSPLAQPEIRAAAEAMKDAYDASKPVSIETGEWHLPYVNQLDWDDISFAHLPSISAARCARVSYLTHDGNRDPEADLALYNKLIAAQPPHASPLEHPATPAKPGEAQRGNFRGWHQLRHLALENRTLVGR